MDSESYEAQHVHSVYEAIAPHFSSTRHSPWPLVSSFLLSQPRGALGLDIGCGNGKYIPVNPAVHILACDRSPSLAAFAHSHSLSQSASASHTKSHSHSDAGLDDISPLTGRLADVFLADCLTLPFRPRSADFAISIAVIHHLSTPERRQAGIASILSCLRPGGRLLLYAWALEQKDSRRGWAEGGEQDALVPWVMREKGGQGKTFQRYYHLYRKGELEEDVRAAGGVVEEGGYEKDNWWVICTSSSSSV